MLFPSLPPFSSDEVIPRDPRYLNWSDWLKYISTRHYSDIPSLGARHDFPAVSRIGWPLPILWIALRRREFDIHVHSSCTVFLMGDLSASRQASYSHRVHLSKPMSTVLRAKWGSAQSAPAEAMVPASRKQYYFLSRNFASRVNPNRTRGTSEDLSESVGFQFRNVLTSQMKPLTQQQLDLLQLHCTLASPTAERRSENS